MGSVQKGMSSDLLQKPAGKEIVDTIRERTKADAIIWMGSCFGACDIPLGIQNLGVDMFVQWGHNMFRRKEGW